MASEASEIIISSAAAGAESDTNAAEAAAATDAAPREPVVKLRSNDGEEFIVKRKTINLSVTIRTMLDDLAIGSGEGDQEEAIELPNINGTVLKKVLEWCEYHADDPPVVEDDDDVDEKKEKRIDDIPSWDLNYLKVTIGMLYHLLLASNYLDIKPLLTLCCKSTASLIKGKTIEEVRKNFNITDTGYTAEEEERIRKENAWAEEN